jgi:glucose-1-phosphate cytidylyltransferase
MGRLEAIPHHGFWAPMDTLKERSQLEELYRSGTKPWALWSHENRGQHGRVLDGPPVFEPTDAAAVAAPSVVAI